MALNYFDTNKDALINPSRFVKEIEDFPDVTVTVYSYPLFNALLDFFKPTLITNIYCSSGLNPVYEINYKGERFAFYQSQLGEPRSIYDYESLIAMGSKTLIVCANCGTLDKDIDDCGVIIPNLAMRDEGCSYHYAPLGETIKLNHKYVDLFKEVLAEFKYPYREGTTWTTDAPFRETKEKVEVRKEQGAICVDMHCAGMQALCDFRETEIFQYLCALDSLDNGVWNPRSIPGNVRLDKKTVIALMAFELGLKIKESRKND